MQDLRAYSQLSQVMSPRAWGCTELRELVLRAYGNVPTCVGVYRDMSALRGSQHQCPHVRGGVPSCTASRFIAREMSPRAWGCTDRILTTSRKSSNVPTCVGVYPVRIANTESDPECPHVRGGVPEYCGAYCVPRINVPTCVGVYRVCGRFGNQRR